MDMSVMFEGQVWYLDYHVAVCPSNSSFGWKEAALTITWPRS